MSDKLNLKQATAIAMGIGHFLLENAEAVGCCILAAQEQLVGPDEPAAPRRAAQPAVDVARPVELALVYAEFADPVVLVAHPCALNQDERNWVLSLDLDPVQARASGLPKLVDVRWTAERGFTLDTTIGSTCRAIAVTVRQEPAKPTGTG